MTQENESGITRHGKVSYMQIPAADPEALAEFYAAVFGWTIRGSSEHRSFEDASGELIGAFVPHLPAAEPGVLPYIYVNGLDAAVASIEARGASIVRAPYPEGDLWVATFRDPAGNVIGLWQMGGR
jgi:predicted enzyme related to lactoylglutathione lyase